MGIGKDAHTARIAPNRKEFENPIFVLSLSDLIDSDEVFSLVKSLSDSKTMEKGGFGERITLTFQGLETMDTFLVLAFGEEKKEALSRVFTGGSLQEIPARFYAMPQIAKKTILITDQKI